MKSEEVEASKQQFFTKVETTPNGPEIWTLFKELFLDTKFIDCATLEWWDENGHGIGPIISSKSEIDPSDEVQSCINVFWYLFEKEGTQGFKRVAQSLYAGFFTADYEFQNRGDNKIWCVHRFKANDYFVFHLDGYFPDLTHIK